MPHTVGHQADRKRPTARSTLPAEICDRWMESPAALWEYGGKLGLDFSDLGFVGLLWSHKWYGDSKICPSMGTLAAKFKVSSRTVSRKVRRLEDMRLLTVERTPAGGVREYNLRPLWDRLAEIAQREQRPLSVVRAGPADLDGSVHLDSAPSATEVSTDPDSSVAQTPTDSSTEVRRLEVRPLSSPLAATREARIRETIEQLQHDVADPQTFPSTRIKLLAQIEKLQKSLRTERRTAAIGRLAATHLEQEPAATSMPTT